MDLTGLSGVIMICWALLMQLLLPAQVQCDNYTGHSLKQYIGDDCAEGQAAGLCLKNDGKENPSQTDRKLNGTKITYQSLSSNFAQRPSTTLEEVSTRGSTSKQLGGNGTSHQMNPAEAQMVKVGETEGNYPISTSLFTEQESGTEVESLLISQRTPKWWDACNKRVIINDSLFNMMTGLSMFHPAHIVDEDRNNQGRFFEDIAAYKNASKSTNFVSLAKLIAGPILNEDRKHKQEEHRHKRSTITTLFDHSRDVFAANELSHDKDLLVLKKPDRWSLAKKTSFSMSPHKKYWSPVGKPKVAPSKSRFYQESDPSQQIDKLQTAANPGESVQPVAPDLIGSRAQAVRDAMSKLNVRVSWQLHNAVSSLKHLRGISRRIERATANLSQAENQTNASLSAERRSELEADWLPKMDTLVNHAEINNLKLGVFRLYQPVTRSMLTNLTDYLEFFNVAFEQMMFELAQDPHKKLHHLRSLFEGLERGGLELQCESESLISSIKDMIKNQQELRHLSDKLSTQPQVKGSPDKRLFDESELFSLSRRSRGLGNDTEVSLAANRTTSTTVFESPLQQAIAALNNQEHTGGRKKKVRASSGFGVSSDMLAAQKRRGRPQHIWRAIMPNDNRLLHNDLERAFRNHAILRELRKFIKFYLKVLERNYT